MNSFLTTGAAEILRIVSDISEEPFTSIKAHLAEATQLTAEDPALVRAYRKDLIKDAQ